MIEDKEALNHIDEILKVDVNKTWLNIMSWIMFAITVLIELNSFGFI